MRLRGLVKITIVNKDRVLLGEAGAAVMIVLTAGFKFKTRGENVHVKRTIEHLVLSLMTLFLKDR